MSELFTTEDGLNVSKILVFHLGHPWAVDDDGNHTSPLSEEAYRALEFDLLRYCTRLRNQPDTAAHTDSHGHAVPAHQLIARR